MSLKEGAKNAVKNCMCVNPDEKVVIISDSNTTKIGKNLKCAAQSITGDVKFFNLESYGDRPLSYFPDQIEQQADRADVTFWTAKSYDGELESLRKPFIETAVDGGRHGHMVNVTEDVMKQGMTGDYQKIKEFTEKLREKLVDTETIRIKNEQGTDIKTTFSDRYKWVPSTGVYHEEGYWGNLPDGEIYTVPATMEGKLVVDGMIGDHFPNKYGHEDLEQTPVVIEVENNGKPRATEVRCENKELEEDLKDYLSRNECTSIVGEFGMGTNIFLDGFTNNSLLDEKYPGVHIAFGDPLGLETDADWKCPEHLDMILTKTNVWLDDEKVIEDGEYLI
ncbi:MAG: aminopeptidase [Candidatus Thermoplasmatota archaeon]|nr:aminopeptidase [Candidatus Thermoplasmatota archaeon]MBS3790806.1 aminopeptidase [Candidatus Thermoplasmatota archaeon]